MNKTKLYDKRSIREGAGCGTGAKMPIKDPNTGKKVSVPRGDNPWEKVAPSRLWSVPAKIRDAAVMDAQKACVALAAKEGRLKRNLRFRTSKDARQSIYLESHQLNKKTMGSLYAPLFGCMSDRTTMRTEDGKVLSGEFPSDCRVTHERYTDRWFICMSVPLRAPETQGRVAKENRDVVAIDPGIRTYATCYDPGREQIIEWATTGGRKNGKSKGSELAGWLTRKMGRLENKAKKAHGRHRRRIRAVAARKRAKVIYLADELHHQLALWLCRNYRVVLLPKYSVKQISRKKRPAGQKRALGRNSVRRLAQLSPFRFRQFLIHKAREFGTTVVICDERYTSQTCTSCGMLNPGLGTAKLFECPWCGAAYDRDHGAARNILLRYVALNDIEFESSEAAPGSAASYRLMGLSANGASASSASC